MAGRAPPCFALPPEGRSLSVLAEQLSPRGRARWAPSAPGSPGQQRLAWRTWWALDGRVGTGEVRRAPRVSYGPWALAHTAARCSRCVCTWGARREPSRGAAARGSGRRSCRKAPGSERVRALGLRGQSTPFRPLPGVGQAATGSPRAEPSSRSPLWPQAGGAPSARPGSAGARGSPLPSRLGRGPCSTSLSASSDQPRGPDSSQSAVSLPASAFALVSRTQRAFSLPVSCCLVFLTYHLNFRSTFKKFTSTRNSFDAIDFLFLFF